jgi:hypothetical protein
LTVDIFGCVKNLIEVIRADLHQRGGEGVAETLSRLAEQDISDQSFVMPGSQLQPVCIFVPHVIFAISHLNVNLASATAEISDHLRWVQSASYTDAALGEGFSKNYAWCELIGPQGFFKGSDFLLGFCYWARTAITKITIILRQNYTGRSQHHLIGKKATATSPRAKPAKSSGIHQQ